MGGLNRFGSETAQVAVALVIREDQYDIGLLGLCGREGMKPMTILSMRTVKARRTVVDDE